MNKFKIVSIAALSFGLMACAPQMIQPKTVVADCVFHLTEKAAPGWICDEPQPDLKTQAVGIAPFSKGGVSFMKDLAAAQARGKLAEQFKVDVGTVVKRYLSNTGIGDAETIDTAAKSVARTISSETLIGTRIYKSRTGPNKEMYVLVGLDTTAAEQSTKIAVSTSMKNEPAVWQQYQAKKGHEEMEAEISKMKVE